MKILVPGLAAITFAIGISFLIPSSFASSEFTTVTPIDSEISLEKTISTMVVPADEKLMWGKIKGKITNPVERYPVIIQFFKGGEAYHFAQVDVKGDDSYEYKFRIRNLDDGNVINIFEGQYTVKIFKVVHSEINII